MNSQQKTCSTPPKVKNSSTHKPSRFAPPAIFVYQKPPSAGPWPPNKSWEFWDVPGLAWVTCVLPSVQLFNRKKHEKWYEQKHGTSNKSIMNYQTGKGWTYKYYVIIWNKKKLKGNISEDHFRETPSPGLLLSVATARRWLQVTSLDDVTKGYACGSDSPKNHCLKRRQQFNAILKCVNSEMHTKLHDIHFKDHVNVYASVSTKTTWIHE